MTTTVAKYGETTDVGKFADRLREFLPNGSKMTAGQAMALAQVSVLHGLDPMNGEIWFIPGVGVMIGVKGLRKKAREQVKGNFWTTFREIADPKERERLMIPADALAFECRLFDSETSATYTETIKGLRGADVPIADVMEMVGKQPYTLGIGVLKRGESTRMLPVECAMKRSEAAALKRRFDVPFQTDTDAEPESYVDASFTAHAPERIDTVTGEITTETGAANGNGNTHAEAEALIAELQSKRQMDHAPSVTTSKPLTRPYPAEKVRENLVAAAGSNPAMPDERFLSGAMASLAGLVSGDDNARRAVIKYLFGADSGKQLTTSQVKALRGWMGVTQNAEGEWIPNGHSIVEAKAIVRAFQLESGQQPLPLDAAETITAGK